MRLILMRHGNTFEPGQTAVQVGAKTDLALTSFGKKQAEWMAAYLQAEKIVPSAIYAGNLKRQKGSAEIIARSLNLEVIAEPALTEIDYGAWEGLRAEEISAKWPKEYSGWLEGQWQEGIFQGTKEGHLSGIENFLNRLRKEARGVVFAVTSGGILRFFQNEKVKTGHFCEVDLLEGGLKIQRWNIDPQYERSCDQMV